MPDETMNAIKSGKGLPPLSGNEANSNKQTGIATEQRADNGITYQTFTLHESDNKKD